MNYILKRSNKKNISISIDKNLNVVVKAPKHISKNYIDNFVTKNQTWIEHAKNETKKYYDTKTTLTQEEINILKSQAKLIIQKKVDYYKKIMNVTPTSVKITSAKTRWGSCSGKNALCFSYRLMLLPDDIIDYVVVHELAHILQKNHSQNFYKVVEKYLPNYKQLIARKKQLEPTLPL